MANKKKEYYKPGPMTEGKRNIIQGLLQEYNIESAADIQEALKDLLGGTIKEMMEAEMDDHLGYDTNLTLKQRYYPISSSNALNILVRQRTNGVTKAMNHILEGMEYFVSEAARA